jgi:carbon-monoxide dehydrogenase medium subunit
VRRFDLLQPDSIDQAVALLSQHGEDARLIAGGAMLTILLRQRLIAPRYLISVADVPGLARVEARNGSLQLGAAATLSTIERHPMVRQRYPVLAEALHLVGNVRVRNVATIGGHLAHADIHLDLPPVLLALGAAVTAQGPRGQRRIALDDLFVGYYQTCLAPDEVIVSMHLPAPPVDDHGVYLKHCSLSPNDWPTVGVAAFVRTQNGRAADVRIVAGSVAERPLRVSDAEALLVGDGFTAASVEEVARRYAQAADPLPDVRGSADYKRRITHVYVRRALLAAAHRAGLDIA